MNSADEYPYKLEEDNLSIVVKIVHVEGFTANGYYDFFYNHWIVLHPAINDEIVVPKHEIKYWY